MVSRWGLPPVRFQARTEKPQRTEILTSHWVTVKPISTVVTPTMTPAVDTLLVTLWTRKSDPYPRKVRMKTSRKITVGDPQWLIASVSYIYRCFDLP